MNIVTHLISTAAPQPPQVPQADEAVPAEFWHTALWEAREDQEWLTAEQCDWIERRARELARAGK
jgi:hypothetical protein